MNEIRISKSSFLKLLGSLSVLCSLMLYYSCEEESFKNVQETNQDSKLIIEDNSFDYFQKNAELTILVKDFESLLESKQGVSARNDDDLYNFTIDSTTIRRIEIDDAVSYTMAVSRDSIDNSHFENLVIHRNASDQISTLLIKYHHEGSLYDHPDHESYGFTGSREIIILDSDIVNPTNRSCGYVAETWCNWGGTDHVAGPMCLRANDGRLFTNFVLVCDEENETEVVVSNGGGGGGGTSQGGDNTVVTSPVGIRSNTNPCEPAPEGDLNGDCMLDFYEACFSNLDNGSLVTLLSPDQRAAIDRFIDENGCNDQTLSFLNLAIEALVNNTLITFLPFFKYPEGSNYAVTYPELTILLREYIPYLKDNARLIATISNLTGLDSSEIKNDLTWGNGPEVHIEQLGVVDGEEIKGKFNPLEPNKIVLDIDLINTLEALASVEDPNDEQIKQLQLFDGLVTFAVCLHEYVHFADYAFDGVLQDNEDLELGLLFEELFIGGYYEFDPNGNVIIIPKND